MLRNNRMLSVAAGAAVLVAASSFGAVAAGLVTSADIKNQTIKKIDIKKGGVGGSEVKDGSLKVKDLSSKAQTQLKGNTGPRGPAGPAGPPGPAANVNALLAGEGATWIAEGDSSFAGFSVTLVDGTAPGTDVSTSNLNQPVQAGDIISFEYTLLNGANCGGGAPRMFVRIDGTLFNTFDNNDAQCGDGNTQEVVFAVPASGTITDAGLVYDNGNAGSVYITDVLIDGLPVFFG